MATTRRRGAAVPLAITVAVIALVGTIDMGRANAASPSITVSWASSGKLTHADELESIACPTDHFCLGLTMDDHLAWSQNPSSGASWHLSGSRHIDSVSCSSQVCLVTMMRQKSLEVDLYASTHPQGGLHSFRQVTTHGNFHYAETIYCPTNAFCAGLDSGESAWSTSGQSAWFSQHPAQPGSWRHLSEPHNKFHTEYSNLVCTTSLVCLAYATNAMTEWVATIEAPTNPDSRWTYTEADPSSGVTNKYCGPIACDGEQFTGGACAAPAECLLTTGYGAIVSSPNIQAGAASWTRVVVYGHGKHQRGYYGLSDPVCFSESLCYALGARGDLLASTTPFVAQPAWQDFPLGAQSWPTVRPTLSCPSPQTCFVLVKRHGHQSVLRGRIAGAG